jgi:acyl-CoA hydrolase
MFTDGLWKLHLAGKVTNTNKGVFPGVSVTTFALGFVRLYEWLDGNADVAFGPVATINDPAIISANHSFVGQRRHFGRPVWPGGGRLGRCRQISGVGGHEDFVAGAELALDDVSLICLRSTIEIDGELRSRLVDTLPARSVIATPRHHTAVVVTEHGVADLRDERCRSEPKPSRHR